MINSDGGPVLGIEMSAVQSMGQNLYGILQWRHMPNAMYMRTGLLYNGSGYSTAGFLQLGLPDSHVSARGEVKVLEHTRLKCSIKARATFLPQYEACQTHSVHGPGI